MKVLKMSKESDANDNGTSGKPGGRTLKPSRIFSVPEDVKHLNTEELETLTQSFRIWAKASRRPATMFARGRIWLIYLLLRYTGGKLGEILALDPQRGIDLAEGTVLLGGDPEDGSKPREVRLPDEARREVASYLNNPAFMMSRERVFGVDGGYIRRKFYERAEACAIPRELANPRVLRHSRAVELLRNGVPLTVVQNILGHGTVNLTAHYLNFSEEDIKAVIHHYLQKEARMKTSARNSFTGEVTLIRHGVILSEVELTTSAGYRVVSVITRESMDNLGIREGLTVIATIKAPNVIVARENEVGAVSARNKFLGKIARINEGSIAAEVVVTLDDGTEVCALVTDVSVKTLGLAVGDKALVMFKAFSVVLNVE